MLQIVATTHASSQPFTIRDLLTLANLPSKEINHFMNKKGFILKSDREKIDSTEAEFIPKYKKRKNYNEPKRNIDFYLKNNSRYFVLHTSSLTEYLEGEQSLIKSDFVYDKTKDINKDSSIIFQKANVAIVLSKETSDSDVVYTFTLNQKKIPQSIAYAEELLQFDSHEFLASYFGEKNVTKDLYYFSENELKKCSVLFSGSPYQVAFVWGDENNLDNLSYIIVSNVLPTKKVEKAAILDRNNVWKLENGIHTGMDLKEVLRLNENDFIIYGNKSDLAFMAKPEEKGKINFKKTAIMFSCKDCYDNKIFDQREISALAIVKKNLPLTVFDIIIYP